jgi:uncharacterized damage-inducible protein DinB
MYRIALVLTVLCAAPLSAQAPDDAPPTNFAVSATGNAWKSVTNYLQAAAEQFPDSAYDFKPTPEVRSFGELIGHVAGSQNMFCAAALGEPQPAEDEVEKKAKSKADLVDALKKSSEYCTRAYAQTDLQAQGKVKMFGQQMSKLDVLLINATHDNEHYGNIVTYMRLKGMVPPSSQPRR